MPDPSPQPAAPPPKPPLARRLWPNGFAATMRPRVRFSAFAAICIMLFALIWPDDLKREEGWFVAISWAVFMVRTFWFHAGIALLLDAVFAFWLRARYTALALVLVGAFAVWPAIRSLTPISYEAAPGKPTITVMSVNLLYGRADAGSLARIVHDIRPDVILFQEYTPESAQHLTQALGEAFPHRIEFPRDDAFGQAIYSRTAFTGPSRTYPPGPGWTEPQLRAQIDFAGSPLVLMDVHVLPPIGMAYVRAQRKATLGLAAASAAEVQSTAGGGAFIIAGDFNATPESANIQTMLAAGLSSAHADAGWGRGSTWPRDTFLRYAPGVRIDHILYAGRLDCLECGVCDDIGSDHRPTYARFTTPRH